MTPLSPTVPDWVVNSQAVGDGRASLKYLAPYVFRVAIVAFIPRRAPVAFDTS